MGDRDYAAEAKRELEAAAACYGITHGFMSTKHRDTQIARAQYHATRAVALTNLAALGGVPATKEEQT